MVITDIRKQKYNESRYNIYIDSKFCFSASEEDVIKFTLIINREFEMEELDEIIKKCEESNAYNYALNILNNKDYTSMDIKNKLKLKQYSNQTIESVLSKLESYGFIDDKKYIAKYVDYSLNIKKAGKNKIIYDLKKKGVKDLDIVSIEINEEIQHANAYDLALKKIRSLKSNTRIEDKIFRYLLSKGYDFDLVKSVVRNIFKGIERD